jgi:hypothetical protein
MTHSVSRGMPFSRPPRPIDALPQRPVADVDDARPEDRVGSMPSALPWWSGCRGTRRQVVRRADGVDVAGQVEVEVLHRDDLAVAAAGGAALDPEHGPRLGWRMHTRRACRCG